MTYTIRIEMDNSAFELSPYEELVRILHEHADYLAHNHGSIECRLFDINGNYVGRATLMGD